MPSFVGRYLALVGWPVLIVFAVLVAVAQFLGANALIRKGLWVLAGLTAVIGTVNEFRSGNS